MALFTFNVLQLLVLLVLPIVIVVEGGLVKCRIDNGPIPFQFRCDTFPIRGDDTQLDNLPTDNLNTNVNLETPAMTAARLADDDEESGTGIGTNTFASLFGNIGPTVEGKFFFGNNANTAYNPVYDAYCFNEDYPVPLLNSVEEHNALYLDYKAVFDEGFADADDIRLPGMFLRMCFHDNTIENTAIDFQTYVQNSIDPNTKKWVAESKYMMTSGADASNLICPAERFHPNNDLDESAVQILTYIQRSSTLKRKHPQMSYADFLHNGCNAAAIYLTKTDPIPALTTNPFTFGRKDACHVDVKCGKKYPLCGPTELLPGVRLNVDEVTTWFTSRGMNECLFMATMWTHTTLEPMGFLCPIQQLACTATADDVNNNSNNRNRYFKAGDNLDYFNFFLNRGTHVPGGDGDGGRGQCEWTVDGNNLPWPMTEIDCTLALSNVERNTGSSSALATVIKNFVHNSTYYNRYDLLQCALNVLGGTGVGGTSDAGACTKVLPPECQSNPNHKFGGYYSTLPPTTMTRKTVDPTCERFGYRRNRSRRSIMETSSVESTTSPTEDVKLTYTDCLQVTYDMYLIIDGVHFVMLTTPSNNDNSDNNNNMFCPPLIVHSVYDFNDDESQPPTMEKAMIALQSDIELVNEETKFHLGTRSLESILDAYDNVHVGYHNSKNDTMYHPITNNCVAMLQNMADPLDIPLMDNLPLQQFVTERLLLYISTNHDLATTSNDDIFQQMIQEFDNEDKDGSIHRLLSIPPTTDNSMEDMISKLIQLYMS